MKRWPNNVGEGPSAEGSQESGRQVSTADEMPILSGLRKPKRPGSGWKRFSAILAILALILGGLAAFLFWVYGEQLRAGNRELASKNEVLERDNVNLREQTAVLTRHLEDEVQRVSKEKDEEIGRIRGALEEEIARVRGTHDEMVKTLQKEIDQGQVKITQLADRLSVNIVDKILFPSGEDGITEEGRKVLKRVGEVLVRAKDKTIRIEGHTDDVPTGKTLKDKFPSNWELSTARATNVVRFLQESAGVDPGALEAVGMGQHHPIASNRNPAGRSRNRRIEIILFPRVKSLANDLPAVAPGAPGGGTTTEPQKPVP